MATAFLESIDRQLDAFFSGWNIASTVILVLCLVVLFYPIFFGAQADSHPFLLARQAQASPVRQHGESSVYRVPETPHGYPLRSGLGVKDDGVPSYIPGRDGDLRYVWREAIRGKDGKVATVLSIKGRDKPVTHELSDMTKIINTRPSLTKSQLQHSTAFPQSSSRKGSHTSYWFMSCEKPKLTCSSPQLEPYRRTYMPPIRLSSMSFWSLKRQGGKWTGYQSQM